MCREENGIILLAKLEYIIGMVSVVAIVAIGTVVSIASIGTSPEAAAKVQSSPRVDNPYL